MGQTIFEKFIHVLHGVLHLSLLHISVDGTQPRTTRGSQHYFPKYVWHFALVQPASTEAVVYGIGLPCVSVSKHS
jgi:hypothetical protein|eukprot:COSAG01_NODE_6468_length_3650_cov_2.143622_3_plen_75_part_00